VTTLVLLLSLTTAAAPDRALTVDFAHDLGPVRPVVGFLGGLRDTTPPALLAPLNISQFRIGHQFRGRIKGGLSDAIDRVQALGATYKLVMSDLIDSKPNPKSWAVYEAAVQNLVKQVGPRAKTVLWEPVNEPDISHKPISTYYEMYAHAFAALRAAEPAAQITGPSFAFPNYARYTAFLDYCREHHLECNDLCWHYTGWDPDEPRRGHWQIEKLRDCVAAYPEQKIREIHCDEWGAAPDKPTKADPGRLQPGRALVWFHYLERVWGVDRACRANWGREDDWLGGIVTATHEPHPAYWAYAWYGGTKGQMRFPVDGGDAKIAALASGDGQRRVILLGSIDPNPRAVSLVLRGLPAQPKVSVQLLANTDLDGVLPAEPPAGAGDVMVMADGDGWRLILPRVEVNQAWRLELR
jgi:hypothetical protein